MMRCHRCGIDFEHEVAVSRGHLTVVSDYCRRCRIDMANRELADARRAAANRRFRSVKDLTPVA